MELTAEEIEKHRFLKGVIGRVHERQREERRARFLGKFLHTRLKKTPHTTEGRHIPFIFDKTIHFKSISLFRSSVKRLDEVAGLSMPILNTRQKTKKGNKSLKIENKSPETNTKRKMSFRFAGQRLTILS